MKAADVMLAAAFAIALGAGAPAAALEVDSETWSDRGRVRAEQVFNGFGCTGGNISPAVRWSDPPPGTLSFAVFLHDADAPTGSGWWHWVVHDIPATSAGLDPGAGRQGETVLAGGGVQGRTDFGAPGYGGPCPPEGRTHRYRLTVYALGVETLGVPAGASAAMVSFMARANALASDTITVRYGR